MKFICKTDKWRQYRGHVFSCGQPTEVSDRGSIEALTGHPDFERVDEPPVNGYHRPILTLPKRHGRPPKEDAVL